MAPSANIHFRARSALPLSVESRDFSSSSALAPFRNWIGTPRENVYLWAMSAILTSTAYFPPVSWYLSAVGTKKWIIEVNENYQKGGFRNRCRIATANGPKWLSIPLTKGKHQATPIDEVEISYERNWAREHRQTIQSAYGRAPFFEFYAPPLLALLSTKCLHLRSLNQSIMEWINDIMGLPIILEQTTEFEQTPADYDVTDLRGGKLGHLSPTPAYPQLFADRHGFMVDLSILDLLFCLGPEAGSYLRRHATQPS